MRAAGESTDRRETPPPDRVAPAPRKRRRRKARRTHPALAALRAWVTPGRAELLLIAALFAAALAIRWPYLLRLPHMTDETVEIEWALRIWRGEIRPLTASDRYYGPLHPYLVALAVGIFGPSIALPRTIVMVFGALTVVLTYLLGRTIGGWRLGLLGAGLLATAPLHILVNSHVAWQNSTTPFYATLAFLLLALAIRHGLRGPNAGEEGGGRGYVPGAWAGLRARAGWPLVGAGAAYGLTLHTHVGTIVLAPALALAFLAAVWRAGGWRIFRTPWPWLTPVAGLLSYSPILAYNLANNLPGVRRVQTSRNYAYEMQLSWGKYWQNMGDLWLELLRVIGNPFRIPEVRWHYLTSPHLLLMAGLCAIGLAILARRGWALPLLAVLCTAAIMPAFNKAYGQTWDRYVLTGRYVAFLLPLAFVAAGATVLAIVEGGGRLAAGPRPAAPGSSPFRLPPAALGLLAAIPIAALVLYPLIPLRRYYTHEAAKDPANASFLATVDFLRAHRDPRTPIVIGRLLAKVDLKDGTDARETFDILLELEPMPHTSPQNTLAGIQAAVAAAPPGDAAALPLIIMTRDECFEMADRRPYQRVSPQYRLRELYWTLPSYYAVYRYVPEGQPGGCIPATGAEQGE